MLSGRAPVSKNWVTAALASSTEISAEDGTSANPWPSGTSTVVNLAAPSLEPTLNVLENLKQAGVTSRWDAPAATSTLPTTVQRSETTGWPWRASSLRVVYWHSAGEPLSPSMGGHDLLWRVGAAVADVHDLFIVRDEQVGQDAPFSVPVAAGTGDCPCRRVPQPQHGMVLVYDLCVLGPPAEPVPMSGAEQLPPVHVRDMCAGHVVEVVQEPSGSSGSFIGTNAQGVGIPSGEIATGSSN